MGQHKHAHEHHSEGFGSADSHEDFRFTADHPFPENKRKCTDIICLLILFAFWGGVFAVLGLSIQGAGGLEGINKVLHGTQIDGGVCGADTLSSRHYVA